MVKGHNERCKDCKQHVFELLSNIFGDVKRNYNLNLPSKPDSYINSYFYPYLKKIYISLQSYRGHDKFVYAKRLPNVDFFVVDNQFTVEFDESQHFTTPRRIALMGYPEKLKLGFERHKWIDLCQTLNRKDNDPIYRDEQRAWYDTLRDFAPSVLNHRPIIRLYAEDYIWCDLSPEDRSDQEKFKNILKL